MDRARSPSNTRVNCCDDPQHILVAPSGTVCGRSFLGVGYPATWKPEPVLSCNISEGTSQGSNHGQTHCMQTFETTCAKQLCCTSCRQRMYCFETKQCMTICIRTLVGPSVRLHKIPCALWITQNNSMYVSLFGGKGCKASPARMHQVTCTTEFFTRPVEWEGV